ncbi:hypothetical protein FB45DRAFT_824159 [Roridomyces roridus]|uniref:AN1-type domain-containing protein n=1 Tax=Roridomyces roridus TaxID=1738132 RepID=A0AAD7CB24_9AGAR|nr:hypothetical protein FB45DRAFT_824159 [Roridomyces roridus]
MAAPRQDHMLSVGTQCSHSSCLLVDFLPIKCQGCQESFCRDHFMPVAHECPKYDPSKFDRIAPNCPLCSVPVPFMPGQDPNLAMESHFNNCTAMTGKPKARSNPVCAKARCGKTLFSPIRCNKCSQQFCPAHRFPADHTCTAPAAQPGKTTGPTAASRLLDLKPKASAAGAATVGAIKTMASSAQAGASRASQAPKPAIQTPNLFSKTDRRAKAERESRRKAMHERAKKGLLSEEEKLILAAEDAEHARHGQGKDCIVM